MAFKTILPSSSVKPAAQFRKTPAWVQSNTTITSTFNASTILLFGSALQGLLLLAIPRFYVLLPTMLILFLRFADTIAISLKLKPNPYLEGVMVKKHTVVVPDTEGDMANKAGEEKIAVLLLCFKINHPLGFMAPHMKMVNEFGGKMFAELDAKRGELGFLGQSMWRGVDERGVTEIMMLSYWRSIDDVVNYSAGPLHKETWSWWDRIYTQYNGELDHIGLSHEVFEAPRSKWENVTENFQPSRLSALSFLRKGDKDVGGVVEDQWINCTVEAKGPLRTSKLRLNWAENHSGETGGDDGKKPKSA